MGKRYFLFPMYSMQMNVVQSLGSRTTGGKAGTFLVTGPGWNGEVPQGMKQVKSPSRYMLILGRTYADGTEQDYEIVNGLQAQFKITPLSAWGYQKELRTTMSIRCDLATSHLDCSYLVHSHSAGLTSKRRGQSWQLIPARRVSRRPQSK